MKNSDQPAFPIVSTENGANGEAQITLHEGLTKKEYFFAAVL